MPFAATVLTLYPEMFPGPLGVSLAGRALADGLWSLDTRNIRDFATDKHRSVDDTPAGGGAGMVLRRRRARGGARRVADGRPMLALTPRGAPLTQARVRELAAGPGAILLCGRFEGFDERIFEAATSNPSAIGDYVLSGGELGAMVLLDACVRLLPGVMGEASGGGTKVSIMAFSNTRTIPVPWIGKDARSPKCCDVCEDRGNRVAHRHIGDHRLDLIQLHCRAQVLDLTGADRGQDSLAHFQHGRRQALGPVADFRTAPGALRSRCGRFALGALRPYLARPRANVDKPKQRK